MTTLSFARMRSTWRSQESPSRIFLWKSKRWPTMPEICRFYGIIVRIYSRDHAPPHFHAIYSGYEALVVIDDFADIRGRLPPRARGLVIEWASLHQDELRGAWDRAQRMETARKDRAVGVSERDAVTVNELIQLLADHPADLRVVVNGYEDGYDDLSPGQLRVVKISLDTGGRGVGRQAWGCRLSFSREASRP